MRFGWVIAITALALFASHVHAQTVAGSMRITGKSASTWNEGEANIIQVAGPVQIDLERTKLSAENAVIWIRPVAGTVDQQQVEIALLGEGSIKQGEVTRSGRRLFVTASVRGSVRITADERTAESLANSENYQEALAIRRQQARAPQAPAPRGALVAQPVKHNPVLPVTPVPTDVTVLPPAPTVVRFQADDAPVSRAPDGSYVISLHGNILLLIDRPQGEHFEMRADHMVLFTTFKTLEEARAAGGNLQDKIEGVYLEGYVRINYYGGQKKPGPEQRLTAERAYYELKTDRAVLTDAVFHTVEPKTQIPVLMRAKTLRQLSDSEYSANDVTLTTSSFAVPSFAVATDKAYVRSEPTGDERLGDLYTFRATHITPEFWGVPVFWLPIAGGSITENAFPLRQLGIGSSSKFGTSLETQWGLFESMGMPKPRDLDLSYRVDYYSKRGPALGLDGKYEGGFVTETTKQPWNFAGELKSYFVLDDKSEVSDLGGNRFDPPVEETFRGRILWEHQHFLPDDWQVQLRGGWVSDVTFMEEWFPREWEDGQPNDLSAYFKRQRNTEALTLGVNYQPRPFVTDAEYVQEQFEIARLPELGYHRIGESFWEDRLTFFSNNRVSALKYRRSDYTLAEQGFHDEITFFDPVTFLPAGTIPAAQPGIPAQGQTGTTGQTIYRADFREEVNYPINAGKFKVVPYVFGRATSYSDSPTGSDQHRLYAGTGIRINTSFWRTDDTAHSDLFDIHRMRHVVEPNLDLYTSGQTLDRNDVYIFDNDVDDIYDVSAVSVGVRQRWQTKRGGPGKWRNVDVVTLNVVSTIFANEPKDGELEPTGFRGLWFISLPEASVPRDNINADATWRVSDDTVVLGDIQYNLEEADLATAAVGLAVRRSERMTWFLGTSYIRELDSNITSFGVNYIISQKYSFGYTQAFDFGRGEEVSYAVNVNRRFDTFVLLFRATYDQTEDESSFGVNLLPIGARTALGTDTAGVFDPTRAP